nr:casp-like protein 4d1 [Quercus suber]
MFGISVIGIGHTLLQTIAFVTFRIVMENDKGVLFEFYGDKVISYLLATGAAAGIGVSIDMMYYNDGYYNARYFDVGLVSAGCLLFAFVFTASLSIMSSYALQKKV